MQATGRLILGRGVLHKALTQYQQNHFRLQSVSPSLSCRSVSSGSPTPIVNPASRPYARHRPTLPKPKSYKLPGALLVLFSVATWSAFTLHATNRERLSSSVLKNVLDRIETSPQVQRAMGDDVSLKKETFLAGDAWIRGSVNMMQGRVDMSFKLKGSKDSGTAYFSAIRRKPGEPYETLRFLIVLDSAQETLSLLDAP